MRLPALLAVSDLMLGAGRLNGRRWAGQQLLLAWAKAAEDQPIALASENPAAMLKRLQPLLQSQGFSGVVHGLGLNRPQPFVPWGAFFIPDLSIGRWAQWRRPVGAAGFSLIGQIHTLSTASSLEQIQELVTEPLTPWDAVICSSSAGAAVLDAVMGDREEQLVALAGGSIARLRSRRPQLPVIPLPIAARQLAAELPARQAARQALGCPPEAAVLLWLGRLSWLTKSDPWPTYALLEHLAQTLDRPLVLIECGPDDQAGQVAQWQLLRDCFPSVQFLRLGGAEPVAEAVKQQALAAADLAISLVDNTQETFGLALAEAMAAGLPVVASDWDGYRDLVRPGVDGFLVPTRWASIAAEISPVLGWQQRTGLQTYGAISGALAQLVQVDMAAAKAALLTLLQTPALARAMGEAAQQRAFQCFEASKVMDSYKQLFAELNDRRLLASAAERSPQLPSLSLDPVRCFQNYPSGPPAERKSIDRSLQQLLPSSLLRVRSQIWSLLRQNSASESHGFLDQDLLRKHQWPDSPLS